MTDQKKPSIISTTINSLTRKHSVTLPRGLHARLSNPSKVAETDPLTRPNRLALMLDISGSMYGEPLLKLQEAVTGFLNACNFGDTALALEPFGTASEVLRSRVALTTQQLMLLTTVQTLNASGGTPMADALDYVLNTYSVTRGVLVSDGQPDREQLVYDAARHYAEAEIPVDCVHIGFSGEGETVLKSVAEITHGEYIKFTDITAFSRSFKYLTPALRGLLTSGAISAAQLGAKEIK